jgi:hypothetical protein
LSLTSKKATPPDWLYAIVVVWVIDKLLDGVYAATLRKAIAAWHWMVPRFMSFVYIRTAKFMIWLVVIGAVTHVRRGGFTTIKLFMFYSVTGLKYQSTYSESARVFLEEMRADLASNGYPKSS